MWRFHPALFALVIGLFSLVLCINSQAEVASTTTTVVEKHIIISPAPKSEKCTTTSGHWDGDVWIDEQTVCTYENRAEGIAWIQDYWTCTVYTAAGNCSNWILHPGHWVKTAQ